MVFFRRSKAGPDPYLDFKSVVFVVGAVLALAGIAFDIGGLITAAIVIMAAALIGTRIARARRPPEA